MFETLYHPLHHKQTYTNMLYVLLAVPLGLCYFVGVFVTLLVGAGLSLVVVGIPLEVLFLVGYWYLASFERKWAIVWLHIDIPPMAEPFQPDMKWQQRLQVHMKRAVTWKSILYLLLKFLVASLGLEIVLLFTGVMIAWSIAAFVISFCTAPFVYSIFALAGKEIDANTIKRYTLLSSTGYGFIFLPLHAVNVLASLLGQMAHLMLGMNDKEIRLAQANVLIEQERARAERANKSRQELMINVSHELRTPVASIRGHIESLMAAYEEDDSAISPPTPETMQKYLQIVHRESLRLGDLVDDLLAVARDETQVLQVNITSVAADEVVEEAYQTLMPLARRERQILMIHEIAPNLPHVQADRQRLTQVLLNLLRNAVTYTPDGGIVSLALKRANDEYVELTISDTGIGIPAEDLERVFERFYRTDASRARTSGGIGLGLAIVRDFVVAMGGIVSVESTVGEGSCFHVLLHIAEC